MAGLQIPLRVRRPEDGGISLNKDALS